MLPLILLCMGAAYAQDGSDDYLDSKLDDNGLVITASRTPEAIDAVPAQISVISAGDIAESGAVSVTDILKTVAGVRLTGGMAGPGSEAVSMRGFGENSYGRVLVLVDGNKKNDPDMKAANWDTIPLSQIERIEVLDGSASVQYGNSAIGGVINIITKKSGDKRTAIGISGGSFFANRESVSHFEPVSWGNFFLSADHAGTKGYRERQNAHASNLAGGADVFIGNTILLSTRASFADVYYQLPGGLTKEQFDDDPRQALKADWTSPPYPAYFFNGDDENTERHFSGGVTLQWIPNETFELDLPLSYTGKLINYDTPSLVDMSNRPTYTARTIHSAEARPQASVEFNAEGMPLRLLWGVDAYFVKLDADIYSDKNYSAKKGSYEISEWTIGPYLTARFSPLSSLSFSTGLRFDTAIIKAENRDKTASGDKIHKAFVYEGGIVFKPLAELKLYAKYARVFRYPFVDEAAQVSGYSDKFNDRLESETGFNAEAGAAYRPGKFIDINANVFFMRLEDEIAYNNISGANENLDNTRHFGTNTSLHLKPADLFSFDVSYSFVTAVFISGNNKDKQVPLVPSHKIYGSLMVNLLPDLSFGPDIEYVSSCYFGQDFSNEGKAMDGYFLAGLRARYVLNRDTKRLALQLTIKNLLDVRYAVYGTAFFNAWAAPPAWEYTLYPADGRSIHVSLHYGF